MAGRDKGTAAGRYITLRGPVRSSEKQRNWKLESEIVMIRPKQLHFALNFRRARLSFSLPLIGGVGRFELI